METKIHIGSEIRKELKKQERTITWLADKVENGDPSNLSKQLNSQHIRPKLLFDISVALKKDFFTFYSQELYGILG